MNSLITILTAVSVIALFGCTPSKESLTKLIEENPEIVFNAIEKNPKAFIDTVNKAAKNAQVEAAKQREMDEQAKIEEEFKNPKKPTIDEKRPIFGKKSAPITIVEYSDFECPYCSRGYDTVKKVREEYGDKVRVIYKHLPLDFHPMAEPAAQYYEAVALQSHDKAEKFHDIVFENQSELKSGKEKYLDSVVKKIGANLSKVKKDMESSIVKERIAADMAEAKKFDFSGTPGFLINGVSLKGAYPFDEFKKVIDRHLEESTQN
ncbi:MAG: thioredoxin domain-containing protein [Bdellovibrionales bacterium]|nr:thioredoxin domain-containing protein [Bdellovibrionales bacterium]